MSHFVPSAIRPGRHIGDKDVSVISAHQHIDNGGHTLSVDEFGNMVVETGFFGYSHTSVMLSAVDIDGMIKFLQDAKAFLQERADTREKNLR